MAYPPPKPPNISHAPRSYPLPARRDRLWMQTQSSPVWSRWTGQLVAIAIGALALATLGVAPNLRSQSSSNQVELCQQPVQSQSFLSRDELSKLLTIAERSSKTDVQNVIAEPYCIMAPSSYREGVPARREAYPLEFDPNTWLIVLYEGDEYAGYDFSFRR